MSQIDSSLEPGLRTVLLSEVRSLLPAFLSAASAERGGPIAAAVELLGLPEADLRRALAVHAMLSDPVRALVEALPAGVRRPVTSSVRPRVVGRTVTSGIDWAATARHRATSSPLGDVWVTRPANRVFDIPENQALAWVLRVLEERALIAVPAALQAPAQWGTEVRAMAATLRESRRTAWLEGIDPSWPGDAVYTRLRADRTDFYSGRVADAARYLRRYLLAPSSEDVVEALSDRFFEPTQDWKLFEIAILMRLCRAMSGVGSQVSSAHVFHDGRPGPFARFDMGEEREVRIWYQRWPPATVPSELDDAIRHYELPSGANRPDIVVEMLAVGKSKRAVVLELKASASATYLSSGLSQLLAYLRDRPGLTSLPASGWLVAPPASSYVSKPSGGRALWFTSSDDVAAAIVDTAGTWARHDNHHG